MMMMVMPISRKISIGNLSFLFSGEANDDTSDVDDVDGDDDDDAANDDGDAMEDTCLNIILFFFWARNSSLKSLIVKK